MAKRNKPIRKTDDQIIWGDEPEFGGRKNKTKGYHATLANSLYWYSNMATDADKKKWLIEWATANTSIPESDLKNIPDAYCGSIGAMCRILSRGFEAKGKDIQNLKDRITTVWRLHSVVSETKEDAPAVKRSVEDQRDIKLSPVYTTFDQYIDGVTDDLVKPDVSLIKLEVNELRDHYMKQYKDVVENPGDYLDPRKTKAVIRGVLDMIESMDNVVKITRARKKKPVTKDKQVKGLNYLNDSPEFGLVSVNPEKLIGAQVAVLFNVKYRTIQYYVADGGLSVKGSTLKDFNGEKSYSKTVRKPEELLPQLTTQRKADKLINELKAKAKPLTGRINKDTIILKVW